MLLAGRTQVVAKPQQACHPLNIRLGRVAQCSVSSPPAAGAATTSSEVLANAGMVPYQVERVGRELERLTQPVTAQWVQARVALLCDVLGSAKLAEALYNGGAELLQQDISTFPVQIERLITALGGNQDLDVVSIVAKEPKLLWASNLEQHIPKVITKLVQIYPYKAANKKAEVIKLIQEYPELLVRMHYYCDDPNIKKVQDLPVDLQNRILKSYC